MKSQIKIQILILVVLASSFRLGFSQKIEANNPLPKEYSLQINKIQLNKKIEIWDSKFLISSSTHNAAGSVGLVGIAFIKMAKTVMNQLETDIATAIPPEKDTVLLKETAFNAYKAILKESEISSVEKGSGLILIITIIDHGFHWSTSSALGVYIRTKVNVVNSVGDILWEQVYYMDKQEKKIPYNRKSLNVKRGVEGLLADYESNPELLKETYGQIFGFLATKLISSQ